LVTVQAIGDVDVFAVRASWNREFQAFTNQINSKAVYGGRREEKGQHRDFGAFLTSGSCSL